MRILARVAIAAALVVAGVSLAMAGNSDRFTPREPSLKQPGHWEWAWDGSDGLSIAVPAVVHYSRGGPARITITGPDALLEKLEVGQGRVGFCRDCWGGPGRLDVTISGVGLNRVELAGAGIDIRLGRLDQDHMRLAIAGTGQISAEGRIDDVWINVAGSGNVHLEKVAARRADINIAGSGDVGLTPREEANIHVAGSGRVLMTAAPGRLKQSITGSGGMRLTSNY